jgi:excisionase family DNA binding protein
MSSTTPIDSVSSAKSSTFTPWMDVREAATYARCGTRSIYVAVRQKQLQAAKLGGRRELRFTKNWLDFWLTATCNPAMVN